jgi:hypothetical protein
MTKENEFFIWEERNSTDQPKNLLTKEENVNLNTTTETKKELTKTPCDDIGKEKRICQWCNKEYSTDSKTKRFCSRSCAASFGNRNFKKDDNHRKQKSKKRYQQTKDYYKKYRLLNKEKYKKLSKSYGIKYQLKYHHKRKKIDINYKLKCLLRGRLRSALNGNYKSGSAVNDLGCSIEQFKKYIESKFTNDMSWNNHGICGWHIDHVKPLTSFDLTDRKQFLEACHYTNLQPLWWKDNISKGNKLERKVGVEPTPYPGGDTCFP